MGFGGASFGSLMGYSYLGMPVYHKGKIQKSWFVKSPLTRKLKSGKAAQQIKKHNNALTRKSKKK